MGFIVLFLRRNLFFFLSEKNCFRVFLSSPVYDFRDFGFHGDSLV